MSAPDPAVQALAARLAALAPGQGLQLVDPADPWSGQGAAAGAIEVVPASGGTGRAYVVRVVSALGTVAAEVFDPVSAAWWALAAYSAWPRLVTAWTTFDNTSHGGTNDYAKQPPPS